MDLSSKEIVPKLHLYLLMLLVINIFFTFSAIVKNVHNGYPDYTLENAQYIVESALILWGSYRILMGRIIGAYILGLTFLVGIIYYMVTTNFQDVHHSWKSIVLFVIQTIGPLQLLFLKKDGISGWRILLDNQ